MKSSIIQMLIGKLYGGLITKWRMTQDNPRLGSAEQFGEESIFSHPINIVGIPAPRDFTAEFKYVYYTEDEDVNDTGKSSESIASNGDAAIPDDLQNFGGSAGDADVLDLYNAAPRFVKFNFIPAGELLSFANTDGDTFNLIQSENNESLIRNNLSNIMDESSWSTTGINNIPYASFYLQDNNIYSDSYNIYSKYCQQVQQEINPNSHILDDIAPGFFGGSMHGNRISDTALDFLQSAAQSGGGTGIGLINPNDGSFFSDSYGFKDASILGQINSKFVGSIAKNMASNPFNIFDSELYKDYTGLQKVQESAIDGTSNHDAVIESYNLAIPDLTQTEFLGLDKELLGEPISLAELENQRWDVELIGYLIEKWEVIESPGGLTYNKKDPVVLGSNDVSLGVDTKVRVGSRYMYRPKTIGMMTVPVLDLADDVYYKVNILIASRPGKAVHVVTDPTYLGVGGDVSRPAGDSTGGAPDISFNYNHESNIMSFHWGWPRDPQRSMRYFKVYRRSSIYEPFQLLALYDFQKTDKPLPFLDKIRNSLVKKQSLGQVFHTMYQDLEFTKDSTYIYAVIAGTAHGAWTNYSPQYVVSFDKLRNDLNVELISPAGAPEPYPNWRLKQDIKTPTGRTNLTEDLLKSSNMDKMYIFLDPDAKILKSKSGMKSGVKTILDEEHILIDPTATDEELLDKFTNGRYFCVINNLDLHKSEKIEIKIAART